MIDEEELAAEVAEVLRQLVADGALELATKNGTEGLAPDLAEHLATKDGADIEGWLVDREEVVEVFVDGRELHDRFRPVFRRLAEGDPVQHWNDALAAAIAAAPDEPNARAVFGDWLEEAGDPRGELGALQRSLANIAADDETARAPLEARQRSLFARYRNHFFGALDPSGGESLAWEGGFIDGAVVSGDHLETLVALPSARLLRRLDVAIAVPLAQVALAKIGAFVPTLDRFTLGNVRAFPEEADGAPAFALDERFAELPRLAVLDACCEDIRVSTARLPALRALRLRARRLTITDDAAVDLGALEELALDVDTLSGGKSVLERLFTSPPPRLAHLRLRGGRDLVLALTKSPLLPRLKTLDLRRSGIRREDVTDLLDRREAFAQLERLDLRGCYVQLDHPALLTLAREVLVGYQDPDAAVDQEYDDEEGDEEGDEDEPDPGVVPNEDHFGGEEELDEPDEDADDDDVVAVDHDAPPEERRPEDEAVD